MNQTAPHTERHPIDITQKKMTVSKKNNRRGEKHHTANFDLTTLWPLFAKKNTVIYHQFATFEEVNYRAYRAPPATCNIHF